MLQYTLNVIHSADILESHMTDLHVFNLLLEIGSPY